MPADSPFSKIVRPLDLADGRRLTIVSLPAFAEHRGIDLARLPYVIRLLLESTLRNCDEVRVLSTHVDALARWTPDGARDQEIPFTVTRVLLQDFTGIPLLTDLAAMRSEAQALGYDPRRIEPLVPAHLVVDHSVQTDVTGGPDAVRRNMEIEFARNGERYALMKWGMQAFETFKVIPPGVGICHQINMEHLAEGVVVRDGLACPDSLVGTDSHTTMINGIGVIGWGVGGIEAEAAMLGQPLFMPMPDVAGVRLTGAPRPGVTATDVVLTVTERLRAARVVGQLVEFFGPGVAALGATDRATIANMAPEYGATCGFFAVDDHTLAYYIETGRDAAQIDLISRYFKAQGLFGTPSDSVAYSRLIEIDLASVTPSLSGPKRPQDRLDLADLGRAFDRALRGDVGDGGYGKPDADVARRPAGAGITHGDVLVAAITSCTNTANPKLLIAAGLVARKALSLGLRTQPWVRTLFTPGSRAVTAYLGEAGLLMPLETLGFGVSAYGCGACVGNIGPLPPEIEQSIHDNDLVCCAVLSGNRNFEARVHTSLRANFLASPPLVVALAIAGTARIDVTRDPLGTAADGSIVTLADLWPTDAEIEALALHARDPRPYRAIYGDVTGHDLWNGIEAAEGQVYDWPASTYIGRPDFFRTTASGSLEGARALAIFGDSITTDHISPAGAINAASPAGQWLLEQGVAPADFNTYGARRGHFEVMVRGTFANARLRNLMLPRRTDGSADEGGFTLHYPEGTRTSLFEAAMRYQQDGVAALIFAGDDYGMGSSRDWAAKGTRLLGVKAVIARSFERIHRSNLVGLGVLPLQFAAGKSAETLGLNGAETFDILGLDSHPAPGHRVILRVNRPHGPIAETELVVRIDTAAEASQFARGGVLPAVLADLLAQGA